MPLKPQEVELHVHVGGRLTWRDLLELARPHHHDIDWTLYREACADAFGTAPDVERLFREACSGDAAGLERFRAGCTMQDGDAGNFSRFQARFSFGVCVMRHYRQVLGRYRDLLLHMVRRDRAEGLRYVEYRAMLGADVYAPDTFLRFHEEHAEIFRAASDDVTTLRYIVSLSRQHPLEDYRLVRRLLADRPDLAETIVGVDFCNVEEGHPPRQLRQVAATLQEDNAAHPGTALGLVIHVGESFFDKSLESAVRWCHEAALLGARRLGHCIALGLDPAAAIGRRAQAHGAESVQERLDQIQWDLEHAALLRQHGITVAEPSLLDERQALLRLPAGNMVSRPYDDARLDNVRRRQAAVLDDLARRGVVIESCPTSNLRIGGVPSPQAHPLHRMLASEVPVVIGSDDPGTFDITLADEVKWIARYCDGDESTLRRRLGDPRRHALTRPGKPRRL